MASFVCAFDSPPLPPGAEGADSNSQGFSFVCAQRLAHKPDVNESRQEFFPISALKTLWALNPSEILMETPKDSDSSRWLLFLCLCFLVSATAVLVDKEQLANAVASPNRSLSSVYVCFVVRTYWGHGQHGSDTLKRLLRNLQAQNHAYWEALLVVADSMTFPDLPYLVQRLNDDRIWIFADLVSLEFTARNEDGGWVADYHRKLYGVTDDAIRACRPNTRWVVITNGDNVYGREFLDELVRVDALGVELVAFDFYSRYYNPTGVPCERFAQEVDRPPCKVNETATTRLERTTLGLGPKLSL